MNTIQGVELGIPEEGRALLQVFLVRSDGTFRRVTALVDEAKIEQLKTPRGDQETWRPIAVALARDRSREVDLHSPDRADTITHTMK